MKPSSLRVRSVCVSDFCEMNEGRGRLRQQQYAVTMLLHRSFLIFYTFNVNRYFFCSGVIL